MVSAGEGWVVGGWGTILHYTGGSWNTVTSLTPNPLGSVFMVSASEGSAVGYLTILHYSGGSWSNYTTTYELHSVSMVNPTEGWAVGDDGTILHYSGGSWSPVKSPTTNELWSVFMVSASDGWAVGGAGTILHYTSAAPENKVAVYAPYLILLVILIGAGAVAVAAWRKHKA